MKRINADTWLSAKRDWEAATPLDVLGLAIGESFRHLPAELDATERLIRHQLTAPRLELTDPPRTACAEGLKFVWIALARTAKGAAL